MRIGDPAYPGVTPALACLNVIRRFTAKGDLVVDPMAGSGTTIDAARVLSRRALGFAPVPGARVLRGGRGGRAGGAADPPSGGGPRVDYERRVPPPPVHARRLPHVRAARAPLRPGRRRVPRPPERPVREPDVGAPRPGARPLPPAGQEPLPDAQGGGVVSVLRRGSPGILRTLRARRETLG